MPDSHKSEIHLYKAENDSVVRTCPAVEDLDGPGPRLQRVLDAMAKLDQRHPADESEAWEQAKVDAYFADRAEYFRSEGLI